MKKLECFFDGESIINQCITVKNRKLPERAHSLTAKVVKLVAAEEREIINRDE